MMGNTTGWLISAVIALLMGWMIFTLGRVEPVSRPSGEFAHLADPIRLPVPPAEALPGVMTEDRDAGDLYRQALQTYRNDPRPYDQFVVKNIDQAGKLRALDPILRATAATRATIFLDKPQTLVNYKFPWPELDALFNLGQLANSIGHYYVISPKNANEELATKYLRAGFSLGAKLYEERLTHGEMIAGIKLMRGASDSLRELAKRKGNATREQQLARFSDQTATYYTTKVKKLYEKVVAANRSDVGAYAGDVFELARHNPDRMWKVEAVLKVGRYKYNATRNGDQIAARRMLGDSPRRYGYDDWATDKDPAVRAAAKAAKELTLEQFRGIQ